MSWRLSKFLPDFGKDILCIDPLVDQMNHCLFFLRLSSDYSNKKIQGGVQGPKFKIAFLMVMQFTNLSY